ncbi:MAG TPA: RnfABCDGE type electron transport complex subunit D [Anaerovoracaceae bacterium]|nr:RnfABCDGE type electron transport complex subunit D [Anaerovoracaceae bacterium]
MENEKKVYDKLLVTAAPHLVSSLDTQKVMANVLVAMAPAFAVGIYVFGLRVISLTLVCVLASVGFEWLYNKMLHKQQTAGDLSAAVTGVLIAFNVPSSLPYWIAIIGCFIAVIIVKQLFGGLGRNFVNPAITARIVLFVSFATQMTTWPLPTMSPATDATTGATPLGVWATDKTVDVITQVSNTDMFLGFIGGCVGEVSAFALLIGGIYLIWKQIISPIIPVAFIGSVFVIALITSGSFSMAIFHVFAGGVMLGAFFMATDYVTTPTLPIGKIIFGVGCGLLTMVIRIWGAYPEGVSFSILLMNVATPLIEKYTIEKSYGGAKKNEK